LSFGVDSRFETMLVVDELKRLIVSYRVVMIGPIREELLFKMISTEPGVVLLQQQ
jgi:hypothetical protein